MNKRGIKEEKGVKDGSDRVFSLERSDATVHAGHCSSARDRGVGCCREKWSLTEMSEICLDGVRDFWSRSRSGRVACEDCRWLPGSVRVTQIVVEVRSGWSDQCSVRHMIEHLVCSFFYFYFIFLFKSN